MKKKYYLVIGIVIVIIALAPYFYSRFEEEIYSTCSGLQNRSNEEAAKININCSVDSDCIYNTNIPCGLCINKNADLRNYESTQNEMESICPPEYRISMCPMEPVSNKCICLQGSCSRNYT